MMWGATLLEIVRIHDAGSQAILLEIVRIHDAGSHTAGNSPNL